MNTLCLAALIGFGAAGGTLIIRALIPLMWLAYKPFGCDLCMSWWCSIIAASVWTFGINVDPFSVWTFGFLVVPAVPVSLITLKMISMKVPQ